MRKAARKVIDQLEEIMIDAELVNQARALKLDVSRAAEAGIAEAVAQERERLWKIENRAAMESLDRYVAEHGDPLGSFRQF